MKETCVLRLELGEKVKKMHGRTRYMALDILLLISMLVIAIQYLSTLNIQHAFTMGLATFIGGTLIFFFLDIAQRWMYG